MGTQMPHKHQQGRNTWRLWRQSQADGQMAKSQQPGDLGRATGRETQGTAAVQVGSWHSGRASEASAACLLPEPTGSQIRESLAWKFQCLSLKIADEYAIGVSISGTGIRYGKTAQRLEMRSICLSSCSGHLHTL